MAGEREETIYHVCPGRGFGDLALNYRLPPTAVYLGCLSQPHFQRYLSLLISKTFEDFLV